MASLTVKSGGSLKGRKGNVFEYNTAYSLKELGNYEVNRIDDNTDGVDLVAKKFGKEYYIECKNRQALSWSTLVKMFLKTEQHCANNSTPLLIFKSNHQPVLVMARDYERESIYIEQFATYFKFPWKKRPKGYKLWR